MRWLAGLVYCAVAAFGQSGHSGKDVAGAVPAQAAQRAADTATWIVREIDDAPTGTRWLLERNPSRPAGPGRLVPAGAREFAAGKAGWPRNAPAIPVIRAGDRIVVERDTPILDVRLEAVALNPALVGSPLAARLAIGGRVVRALALGPGRAELAPGNGQP